MYAFTQDVPIDEATYGRIVQGLGEEPPAGLISHVAVVLPEGGLRYIDVWESEADWDRFAEDRLHPVVHALLAEVFGEELPPEPPRTSLVAIDSWGPNGRPTYQVEPTGSRG
jgi:hypothetical protein